MEKVRSVYRRGAEDGLIMGPLMAVTVILSGMSSYYSWAFLPSVAGLIAVPLLLYRMLRAAWHEDRGRSSFSALWLQGICTFFFGSLLMAALVFAALRWIWPGYIADQMRMLINFLDSAATPDSRAWSKAIGRALDRGELPQPIDLVLELMYIVVFTGSLLSMLCSMLVRLRKPQQRPPQFND